MKKSFATRGRSGPFHVEQFCGTLLCARQTGTLPNVSNARRPRAESNVVDAEISEPASTDEPTPPDPLADYKSALVDLTAASEKLTTLRQVEVSLRADADGIAGAKEKLLADSVEASDDDGAIEELSRLRSRGELFERKLGAVAQQIRDVEEGLGVSRSVVAARFSSLWHGFYQWKLGEAQKELEAQLIPGLAEHVRQLVARHFKSVQPVRELNITMDDAKSLLAQAPRLLEAISVSGWSDVPAYTPPAPSAPELDPLWVPGVPWADRGVDVDAEIRQMHQQDPTLTLPRAMRLLYERHPEIFAPPKEGTLSLNESLPSLPTGVSDTLMGHLGDTFSTEEEFKVKIAARREKAAATT
jgi:hypothetical protein